MKVINISEDGAFNFVARAYAKSTFYVTGDLGGGTLTLSCHEANLGELTKETPLVAQHGIGAPLKVTLTGSSGANVAILAYAVE